MNTECIQESFEFHPLDRREVIGKFDGGRITSDGWGLAITRIGKKNSHHWTFCELFYRLPASRSHRA